ncbi:MAG: GNAT family N-acetyltransferase [Lachnospiraceae bacterium]|nr:GNAT family N-acetyltransferase [Lachnospiraceae bacterium]
MSGIVRRANENDIEGILKLLVQVDMVHHNGRPDIFKGPATKYNAVELKKIVEDDTTPVFVYQDEDGTVAGHAFCVHKQVVGDSVLTDIRTLYIDDICVDEKHRGKRVGSRLFEEVKDYAQKNGFYNITLNVWSCNPGAKEFYEKLGLVPQKIGMEMLLER